MAEWALRASGLNLGGAVSKAFQPYLAQRTRDLAAPAFSPRDVDGAFSIGERRRPRNDARVGNVAGGRYYMLTVV